MGSPQVKISQKVLRGLLFGSHCIDSSSAGCSRTSDFGRKKCALQMAV